MDRARDDFFACAAFARHEDRRLIGSRSFQELEQCDHAIRGSHDGSIADSPRDIALEECVLSVQFFPFVRLAQGEPNLCRLEGLRKIVVRAAPNCFDGEILGSVR